MSYMTLTRISYKLDDGVVCRESYFRTPFNVSSLDIVIKKMSIYLESNQSYRPPQFEVFHVLADSPQTLQRNTYSSAYDLLTELPGKLVVLNGINVPRKLQRFPAATVYEATQVYRTKTGEWKLVCERFQARNSGSVVVPVTCLLLLQTPVPPTPSSSL